MYGCSRTHISGYIVIATLREVSTFLLIKVSSSKFSLWYELTVFNPGYPSSPWVIHPFNETELRTADAEDVGHIKVFNQALSSVHIASEHAFGILKHRFLSLKKMGTHNDVQSVYKVIEALMILHNICMIWKDECTYS